MFGGAGSANARGSSANNPMYVIDVAGGNGGGLIGSLTGNNSMISGGGIGGGGGILDSIGGLFSKVTSGIGDFFSGFSQPQQLSGPVSGGGILDTIGNFFSGFFANGGMIPAGKFGIVGENGPEFAAGPGTIMPMGGGGGSSVTYNINAVDARSFQALLAQDPGFVHAVVQQGARGIPQRR
jgi:hypothetical protein